MFIFQKLFYDFSFSVYFMTLAVESYRCEAFLETPCVIVPLL